MLIKYQEKEQMRLPTPISMSIRPTRNMCSLPRPMMVTPRSQMRSRSGLRTKTDPMFRQPQRKMIGEASYIQSLKTGQ